MYSNLQKSRTFKVHRSSTYLILYFLNYSNVSLSTMPLNKIPGKIMRYINPFYDILLSQNIPLQSSSFYQIIGKCRMLQHLPQGIKNIIAPILFGDHQMGAIMKDYYKDRSFCTDQHGRINLWRLYNLFTGVNKNSYIDSFLDRSVNAYSLVEEIRWALYSKNSWYLN
jgi:hypothetical protein